MGRAKFYLLPAVGLSVLVGLPSALATASTNNDAIQNLYNIILIPSILIGGLVYVLVFSAILLFRRKPGRPRRPIGKFTTEHRLLEVLWTLIPAFVLIFVGVLSIQVLSQIEYVPPGAKDVTVTGHQWYWTFTDPATNTTTTNVLTVEVGQIIHIHLSSADVIHELYIPDMGVAIDANPGSVRHAWFQPTVPGAYIIQCAEFCGLGHYGMKAKLVVVPKPTSQAPKAPSGGSSLKALVWGPPTRSAYLADHMAHLGLAVQVSQNVKEQGVLLNDGECQTGAFPLTRSRIGVTSPGFPGTASVRFPASRLGGHG